MNFQELNHIPFWPFVLMALVAGLVFYARAVNGNIWSLMMRGAFSNSANYQLIRDENAMENTFSGLLSFAFFVSTALFLFNLNEIVGFGVGLPPILSFFAILFFLFAAYIVKVLTAYLTMQVFDASDLFEEYLVALMNINVLFGVCLIPLNLLTIYGLSFNPILILKICCVLWVVSVSLRLFRLFEIGRKKGIKLHNIILYLCTLEIIPIVLLMETLGDFGIKITW